MRIVLFFLGISVKMVELIFFGRNFLSKKDWMAIIKFFLIIDYEVLKNLFVNLFGLGDLFVVIENKIFFIFFVVIFFVLEFFDLIGR